MSLDELLVAIEKAEKQKQLRKRRTKAKKRRERTSLEEKIESLKPKVRKGEKKVQIFIEGVSSDQLRAIYFILFGRVSRKNNLEVAKEIVEFLQKFIETYMSVAE